MGSCNSAAACSSATCPICLKRFTLTRRFLKFEPQLNPGSVLRIPPQSHHLLPICCCWRFHVTCQLLCTIHDVSSVNGKKIDSCGQCSIPSGCDKAQNLSDQWLFLHAQLSQFSFLHNVICFVSHFLILIGHGNFQRCQIGCSCFADDCFCVFPICLIGYPDSIVLTELSIKYLHLPRHPWSVQTIVVWISSFDSNSFFIQTRSTGSPGTTKSSPCTRHFKTSLVMTEQRAKPYQLSNREWPSFIELSCAYLCTHVVVLDCFLRLLTQLHVNLVLHWNVEEKLERCRTPSMTSFWDHSWCVKSVLHSHRDMGITLEARVSSIEFT